MKASTFRSLGFALPIVLLATALHVEKDPAWGSWLDGLLSGAWFAGLFALGAWIVSRSGAFDRRVEGRAAALELAAPPPVTVSGRVWQLPHAPHALAPVALPSHAGGAQPAAPAPPQ